MTDAVAEVPEEPKKSSKMPLIIGLVLALAGGGGGFFAVSSGMLLSDSSGDEKVEESVDPVAELPPIAFVELDPIMIAVTNSQEFEFLRLRAHLEVDEAHVADVEKIRPRVLDVLNSYLRALEISDFEDPAALTRLRAQMLRRIQIVTGKNRVRDLLIIEFLLN